MPIAHHGTMFWSVVLLLLVLYIYYKWGYLPFQVFKKIDVPGPPPVPFFGNILPMIFRKEGMDIVAEWHHKYGPVCGYYCGTWPAIAIADPQFIQNVFITKFSQFPDRGTIALMNTQATGLPPGIFEYSKQGIDHWKKVRHITLPAFTKSKLTMMSHYLEKSCLVMLDRMLEESSANQKIDVMRIYRDCALESAILAVLGQEVQLQKGEAHEFKSWMELGTSIAHGKHPLSQLYMFLPVDVFIAYQFPLFVKFYHWLGLGRYLPVFRSLKTVITDCIKERRQKAKVHQLQDNCVLNLLVAASESEDSDSVLSDEDLISNCLNFLFAAYDTTSLTLTCASHLLATNTHVQDKLCDMLDDYWSQNKDASVSDVAQEIPYLDMILDETMRLYPPSPRLSRVCRESNEVCGIRVPKDICISVSVHYVHRIKSIWGDPDIFRPERFDKEESASRPSCCYLPMGLGPRNCIGLKLAKFLMKIALVTILKHHYFTSTQRSGKELETDCYCVNLTLKSKVFVNLQRRN